MNTSPEQKKQALETRLGTMTVAELVTMLSGFDSNDLVAFAYPYGDRVGTDVTGKIVSIDHREVVWSDQHRSFKLIDPDSDWYDDSEKLNVVVLKESHF